MDKKLFNKYKKAHKDMINWLLKESNIEIGATPDDYLNHLSITQDRTNTSQFYPIADRLYYFCAFAYQVALDQGEDPEIGMCSYCPFGLSNDRRIYTEESCDYWTELPHAVRWKRKETSKELNQWMQLMKNFRDKQWDESWID